ncbi:ATP-binding cassette domain-containing protein, partial [Nostoc punctiforme UO1]|uniref:ATP-binding cassette domain-containing protein n=1 Tax=Nostoc punctiforme TaxID=272131 RepID=UPI0030A0E342
FAILHFGRRKNALISIYISYDLRQAFYAHLQRLGRGFYANYHLGDLIARATNDMESIRRFFRSGMHRLVSLIGVTLIAPIFMLQQSLHIIGRVGSGKSTLLRLLARQLEPNSGQIKLDGQDLKDVPLSHLRQNLSFVPQDAFLFAAPISENISFDKPDRPPESIWQAARY